MLGGADNSNGELLSYIIGANTGIETYRRWAFSLHGGKLFDEIAAINDSQPCYGIYTGICE